MNLIGRILWISQRDGNGVIMDNDGNEFYFDSSVATNFSMLSRLENNTVTFVKNESISHCLCARDVKLLD